MKNFDDNPAVQSLLRLRKRYTTGPRAAVVDQKLECDRRDFNDVLDEMKKLVRQRDEARQELCRLISKFRRRANTERPLCEDIAAELGWNCFNDPCYGSLHFYCSDSTKLSDEQPEAPLEG